jgi:DNA-binding winged helix-turn-helix (wHTH) protein/tetratricopeptide (TPR) repeat protein
MKEFPPFRLDTANQCLWRRGEAGDDERILVTPKAFAVLRYLVEHAGRLVTQDELLEAVWPDTFVQPEVLKYQIADIRGTLGDRARNSLFIETLPRRGYRFVAAVKEGEAAGAWAPVSPDRGRLVGRDRELGALRAYLRKALKGELQIVFITGDPGIGKTALVDEFQRQAAAEEPALHIARGQCVEGYGGSEAYYPVLEALGQLCHGPPGKRVVEILVAQAPTWLVQFPALLKREQRQMLQQEILGATRERMLREIREALTTLNQEAPLLLVLEDLQWVDPSTVDLISAVARQRTTTKALVIITKRPVDMVDPEHPLKRLKQDLLVHHLCREIVLAPLEQPDVAEYLGAESPGGGLPEGFAELIHRHSEGNPLVMVATLDHMTERGLVSHENGKWSLRIPLERIGLEVPETVRQTIEAQIERLTSEQQRTLEVASVNGVSFSASVSAIPAGLDEERFEDLCDGLSRRRHMVRWAGSREFPDGTVSVCYEFAHALYREVFYHRQTPGRRARLHLRIGERLKKLLAKHESEAAGELAGHFEQGGDWQRAVRYLRLAADTAGRRFAPRQAVQILEHALDLVRKLPEAERTLNEIEILEELAAIHAVLGDSLRAIETYEALAGRAAHDGLIEVEVRALIDMAWPLSWINPQRSLEVLEQALRLSARLEDPLLRARMRTRCFAWRLWQGWNPQDMEDFHNASAEICDSDDRRKLAPYLVDCGFISCLSSEYREAYRNLMESRAIKLEAAEENPYLSPAYVRGLLPLTLSLLFVGEWGEALREIRNAIAILDRNADYNWGQGVRPHLAWIHLQAMDFTGVLALCTPALPLAGDPESGSAPDYTAPYRFGLWKRLFLMGSAETALGDYESALEHLLAAQADMDRPGPTCTWYWRMPLENALTELWLAKGDLTQARLQAERSLAIALASAEHMWQALAWQANARVAMAELDVPRARDSIAQALSAMEGFEVPLAAWRVHAAASELHSSADRDLAARHLALSRETIMKLANSLPAEEPIRRTFLSAPMIRKILGDSEARVEPDKIRGTGVGTSV